MENQNEPEGKQKPLSTLRDSETAGKQKPLSTLQEKNRTLRTLRAGFDIPDLKRFIAVSVLSLSSDSPLNETQAKALYGRYTAIVGDLETARRLNRYIRNSTYDLKSPIRAPILPNRQKITPFKDSNDYMFISRQNSLIDASFLQTLKILFAKNKISRFQFKSAIRRAKAGGKQKQDIIQLINAYRAGIKASTRKNTLKRFGSLKNPRPRVVVPIKGAFYSVVLKRGTATAQDLINSIDYAPFIKSEAEKRLKAYNNLGIADADIKKAEKEAEAETALYVLSLLPSPLRPAPDYGERERKKYAVSYLQALNTAEAEREYKNALSSLPLPPPPAYLSGNESKNL